MKTEIEVKFCNVDIDDMRARLEKAGATCAQPMRLMRRQVFYLVDRTKDAYLRVRDEGDKVTMTYKQFDDHSLHGAQEIEVQLSSFEDAVAIIREAGLEPKSSQETKRETWQLGDVEIVIDEWPWLPPFIEIEGPSESEVKDAAKQLALDWNDAVFGGATQAYQMHYKHLPKGFIMDDVAEIRFDLPPPDRLKG